MFQARQGLKTGLVGARHLHRLAAPPSGRLAAIKSAACEPRTLIAKSRLGTEALARLLARDIRAADCYCLHGDVGAGKSVFSRAFIRAVEEDDELPVPSPTYLLQNIYDEHAGPPVHHFDLYRIESGRGLGRLEMDASLEQAVCLIEWSDRLPQAPTERLDLFFTLLNTAYQERLTTSNPNLAQHAAAHDMPAGLQDPDTPVEDDPYADRRWREIKLQPHGHRFTEKVQQLFSSADLGAAGAADLVLTQVD